MMITVFTPSSEIGASGVDLLPREFPGHEVREDRGPQELYTTDRTRFLPPLEPLLLEGHERPAARRREAVQFGDDDLLHRHLRNFHSRAGTDETTANHPAAEEDPSTGGFS
jgi:hypothetical protein